MPINVKSMPLLEYQHQHVSFPVRIGSSTHSTIMLTLAHCSCWLIPVLQSPVQNIISLLMILQSLASSVTIMSQYTGRQWTSSHNDRESFKFIGVHMPEDLYCTLNTTYLGKNTQQHLHFLYIWQMPLFRATYMQHFGKSFLNTDLLGLRVKSTSI